MSERSLAGTVPVRAGGLRSLTLRHPLTVFLALVLVPGWALLCVPVLASAGVLPGGQLPVEVFALAVTLLVMLPAALWVTVVVDGRPGVRDLLARAVRWRFGAGWWGAVLLGLPLLTVGVGLALGGSLSAAQGAVPLLPSVLSVLVALLVVHLWEEMVWAGFLQTRLERRHGLVAAALLTAVPFTAIHVPLLLLREGDGQPGPGTVLADVGLLLVLAAALRLMVGVFLRAAADSVLAAAVLHAVFNASNNAGGLVDGVLSGADQGLAAAIAVVVLSATTALLARRRTSRTYRTGTAAAAGTTARPRGRGEQRRRPLPAG